MYPVIEIVGIKLIVFPFFLLVAIYTCLFVYIISKKYDSVYLIWIKDSLFFGVLGALLLGKCLYAITRISNKPENTMGLFDGFVFFGGLIGSVLGIYVFCIRKKARFLDMLDTYLSFIPLGQAIGRVGCYCNGCCYGKEYTGFLSVDYIVRGEEVSVYPTWFLESLYCFLLFMMMFCISKQIYSGMYAAIYMILYSPFRFVIEFYRGDVVRGVWYGLSTSQYISVCTFMAGIVLLIVSCRMKEKNLMMIGRN